MNELPESKWYPMLDMFYEGKSNREIAKILKISRTTVQSWYKNHVEFLKEEGLPEPPEKKGGYWWHKKHLT